MIVYNANAVLAICIGALCGFGGYAASHNAYLAALVGACAAGLFDFITRVRSDEESSPLLHPNAGGHVWFAPIWLVAVVVAVVTLLAWLGWI